MISVFISCFKVYKFFQAYCRKKKNPLSSSKRFVNFSFEFYTSGARNNKFIWKISVVNPFKKKPRIFFSLNLVYKYKSWGISKFNRLLKKSFFSQTRPWANKSKILSAGLPEANRIVFEK